MKRISIFLIVVSSAFVFLGCTQEYKECMAECRVLSEKESIILTIDSLRYYTETRSGYRYGYGISSRGKYEYGYTYGTDTHHKTKLWLSNGDTHTLDFRMSDKNRRVIKKREYQPRRQETDNGEKIYVPTFVGYRYRLE